MFLWTAFLLGLVGSVHCVGMCGPIALSLPLPRKERIQMTLSLAGYHLGKTTTYMLLGLIFGLIGRGLFLLPYQAGISIGLGIILLILALLHTRAEQWIAQIPGWKQVLQWVRKQMGLLLKKAGPWATVAIGALNGLLPCGLVYVAIVGAISTGKIGSAMAYMGLFGLGTMPLLLMTSIAGVWLKGPFRRYLQWIQPALLLTMALLLIMRGFNVEIPVGLPIWEAGQEVPMCH